jgi:hypothetical protein
MDKKLLLLSLPLGVEKFCIDKKLGSINLVLINTQTSLQLTCDIYNVKNCPGAFSPGPQFKEKGGKEGRKRKEGRGGEHPRNKILRLQH